MRRNPRSNPLFSYLSPQVHPSPPTRSSHTRYQISDRKRATRDSYFQREKLLGSLKIKLMQIFLRCYAGQWPRAGPRLVSFFGLHCVPRRSLTHGSFDLRSFFSFASNLLLSHVFHFSELVLQQGHSCNISNAPNLVWKNWKLCSVFLLYFWYGFISTNMGKAMGELKLCSNTFVWQDLRFLSCAHISIFW